MEARPLRVRPEALRGLALPIYEELGDLLGQANALNNLGVDAYYEGRWQEALETYERPPLDDGIRAELDEYVARRRAEIEADL